MWNACIVVKILELTECNILRDCWTDLNLHVLLDLGLEILAIDYEQKEVKCNEASDNESQCECTYSILITDIYTFFFKPLCATWWHLIEACTNSFENIVWVNLSLESLAIDSDLWVHMWPELIPISGVICEDFVVIVCVWLDALGRKSVLDTLINTILLDFFCFYSKLVTSTTYLSFGTKLMHGLYVVKEFESHL